jgi:hypothetical protein
MANRASRNECWQINYMLLLLPIPATTRRLREIRFLAHLELSDRSEGRRYILYRIDVVIHGVLEAALNATCPIRTVLSPKDAMTRHFTRVLTG